MSDVLQSLISDLRHFADEREWAQFHSPKNLATALSIEAAELQEVFLWLTEQQSRNLSPKQLAKAREELGDVCLYLLQLSDKLGAETGVRVHFLAQQGVVFTGVGAGVEIAGPLDLAG